MLSISLTLESITIPDTKLVGNTHAGVFQALLQLLMGVAQTVGGQLTGIACKRFLLDAPLFVPLLAESP